MAFIRRIEEMIIPSNDSRHSIRGSMGASPYLTMNGANQHPQQQQQQHPMYQQFCPPPPSAGYPQYRAPYYPPPSQAPGHYPYRAPYYPPPPSQTSAQYPFRPPHHPAPVASPHRRRPSSQASTTNSNDDSFFKNLKNRINNLSKDRTNNLSKLEVSRDITIESDHSIEEHVSSTPLPERDGQRRRRESRPRVSILPKSFESSQEDTLGEIVNLTLHSKNHSTSRTKLGNLSTNVEPKLPMSLRRLQGPGLRSKSLPMPKIDDRSGNLNELRSMKKQKSRRQTTVVPTTTTTAPITERSPIFDDFDSPCCSAGTPTTLRNIDQHIKVLAEDGAHNTTTTTNISKENSPDDVSVCESVREFNGSARHSLGHALHLSNISLGKSTAPIDMSGINSFQFSPEQSDGTDSIAFSDDPEPEDVQPRSSVVIEEVEQEAEQDNTLMDALVEDAPNGEVTFSLMDAILTQEHEEVDAREKTLVAESPMDATHSLLESIQSEEPKPVVEEAVAEVEEAVAEVEEAVAEVEEAVAEVEEAVAEVEEAQVEVEEAQVEVEEAEIEVEEAQIEVEAADVEVEDEKMITVSNVEAEVAPDHITPKMNKNVTTYANISIQVTPNLYSNSKWLDNDSRVFDSSSSRSKITTAQITTGVIDVTAQDDAADEEPEEEVVNEDAEDVLNEEDLGQDNTDASKSVVASPEYPSVDSVLLSEDSSPEAYVSPLRTPIVTFPSDDESSEKTASDNENTFKLLSSTHRPSFIPKRKSLECFESPVSKKIRKEISDFSAQERQRRAASSMHFSTIDGGEDFLSKSNMNTQSFATNTTVDNQKMMKSPPQMSQGQHSLSSTPGPSSSVSDGNESPSESDLGLVDYSSFASGRPSSQSTPFTTRRKSMAARSSSAKRRSISQRNISMEKSQKIPSALKMSFYNTDPSVEQDIDNNSDDKSFDVDEEDVVHEPCTSTKFELCSSSSLEDELSMRNRKSATLIRSANVSEDDDSEQEMEYKPHGIVNYTMSSDDDDDDDVHDDPMPSVNNDYSDSDESDYRSIPHQHQSKKYLNSSGHSSIEESKVQEIRRRKHTVRPSMDQRFQAMMDSEDEAVGVPNHSKIIRPGSDGTYLRRSKRNRLPPCRSWENQRPVYKATIDLTGNVVRSLVGITDAKPEQRRHHIRTSKPKRSAHKRFEDLLEMSMHASKADNIDEIVSYKDLTWSETNSAGVFNCIRKRFAQTCIGLLKLSPMAVKKNSSCSVYSLHCLVAYGVCKIRTRNGDEAHEMIVKTGGFFEVPLGGGYSIANLREDECIIDYTIIYKRSVQSTDQ